MGDKENLMSLTKSKLNFEQMKRKEGYFYAFFKKINCSNMNNSSNINNRNAFYYIKTDIFSENLVILRKDFNSMCALETGRIFQNNVLYNSTNYIPEPQFPSQLQNHFEQTHNFSPFKPEPQIPPQLLQNLLFEQYPFSRKGDIQSLFSRRGDIQYPFSRRGDIQSPWNPTLEKFMHKIILLDNGKVYILKILQDGNALIMKPKSDVNNNLDQPPELIPSFLKHSVQAMAFCRDCIPYNDGISSSKYHIPYGIRLYYKVHPKEEFLSFDPFECNSYEEYYYSILFSKNSAGFLTIYKDFYFQCALRFEYTKYETSANNYGFIWRPKIVIASCSDKVNRFENVKHYELSEDTILEKMKQGTDFQQRNENYN